MVEKKAKKRAKPSKVKAEEEAKAAEYEAIVKRDKRRDELVNGVLGLRCTTTGSAPHFQKRH